MCAKPISHAEADRLLAPLARFPRVALAVSGGPDSLALMHLAAMRVIAASVPPHLAATAQALYALGPGLATALLVWVSGRLYGEFGPRGFLAMAALCVVALVLALRLRRAASPSGSAGTAR